MEVMKMVMSFKIDKELKQALQKLADKEYRSLSNYVIMVLKKHLDEKGIPWKQPKK
jgi:predicted transcriptional regulator